MTVAEKLKWIVLPSLIAIGVGVLEIQHPHALDNFDDNYTGRGAAGLVLLIIELLLKLTWGQVGGTCIIILGIAAIVFGCLPSKKQAVEGLDSKSVND